MNPIYELALTNPIVYANITRYENDEITWEESLRESIRMLCEANDKLIEHNFELMSSKMEYMPCVSIESHDISR